MSEAKAAARVVFLDNLRYLLVLCVVVEHASNAYNGLDWWPVADTVSLTAQFLAAISDAFAMPLLFYVAGYFAIPSLQKHGPAGFLQGKLRRLGIPWLVCILAVCPVLPLIYHYTRGQLNAGYWRLWLELTGNALEFNVGVIPSMNGLMAGNQFYQRYMWFLSLLLVFFAILAGLYALKSSWFQTRRAGSPAAVSVRATLGLLLAVGGLTTACSFVAIGLVLALGPKGAGPEALLTLGNLIQFRPSRLPSFVIYFALGVLTYRNRWIERGRMPGHLKTWLAAFAVLLAGLLALKYLIIISPHQDRVQALGPFYFLMMTFFTMAALGLFMSIAMRYWNRNSAFDRSMAANSYNIYLAHYLPVIGLQLALLAAPGLGGLSKFMLATAGGALGGYVISRCLIQPFPRATIATAFGLWALMAVFI